MVDFDGGGRLPPPESHSFDSNISFPAGEHGGRPPCESRSMARGSDGRFLALSKETQMNLDVPGAASMAFSDEPMVVNGLLPVEVDHVLAKGVSAAMQVDAGHVIAKGINSSMQVKNLGVNEDCGFVFSAANIANLPSSSLKFCLGAEVSHDSLHKAAQNHPQGVCGNVPSSSSQPASISPTVGNMFKGDSRSGSAWQRPKVIPMAPISELGAFSKDANTAILDEEEINVTVKKFETAIVGRMFGKKIPYPQLVNELKHRWGAFGEFKIVTISGDCFVCFFKSVEVRDSVLLGGPWVLFGQVLGVDRWTPQFSPSSAVGYYTPVWIRMPCLPLYCWSSNNIGRIAALIGEPLWLDAATDKLDRGMYARVCVRIDLSQPLKAGVWVEGCHGKFFQALEYEGLSIFCCQCGQVGHKESACKIKSTSAPSQHVSANVKTTVKNWSDVSNSMQHAFGGKISIPSVQDKNNIHDSPLASCPPADDNNVDHHGVGPWMMVVKKKKKANYGPSSKFSQPGFIDNRGKNFYNSKGAHKQIPSFIPTFQVPRVSQDRASPQRDRASSSPHQTPIWTHAVQQMDRLRSKENDDMASNHEKGKLPIFSGFSALPSVCKNRTVKSKSEKSTTVDSEAVAFGTRKRRKQHGIADGGDGSSSRPP